VTCGPETSLAALTDWRRRAAAIFAALLLCTLAARAQDVSEPSLKAAFIYNFAKFTEWPADALPGTAPFNACVLGDDAIGDALERSVNGRRLSGRGIGVSRVTRDGPLRSCHLLYLSGVTAAQAAAILKDVRGAPVLTISEADDFARLGGIAHMFVENGRMRFNINLEQAKHSHLQLSSKLLVLAARVLDAPGTGGR
jgi:hypothetical protein